MTLAEMQALLSALLGMRFGGVRSITYLLGAVLGIITATGKFKMAEVGAVDGSAVAVAVLAFASNATAGDTTAVIIRRGPAIVSRAALVFHPSVTAGALTTTKLAELIAVGIVPRTTA